MLALAFSLGLMGPQHSVIQSGPEDTLAQSLQSLAKLAKVVKRNLVVEFTNYKQALPDVSSAGEQGCYILAGLLGRTVTVQPGFIIITGLGREDSLKNASRSVTLLNLLGRLSEQQLKDAREGRLYFKDIPHPLGNELMSALAISPEYAAGMARNSSGLRLILSAGFVMRYQNEPGGAYKEVVIPSDRVPLGSRVQQGDAAVPSEEVPEHAGQGLDFSSGQIMLLPDFLLKGSEAFKQRYVCDPRLASVQLFVSGTFEKARFDNVVEELTKIDPTRPSSLTAEAERSALANALRGPLKSLYEQTRSNRDMDLGELLKRPSMSADELSIRSSNARLIIKQMNLAPNASVQVAPMVQIDVDGGTPDSRFGLVIWNF